jgi:tetratricopeptide (TPR) repeat protein
MGRFYRVLILVICLGHFGGLSNVEAQSRKKKDKEEQSKTTKRNLLQAEVIFLEGEKYFMIEDYNKALIFFQKSLELNPENDACHYKVAEILVLNEDYERALVYATKALELDRSNKYYYLQTADIYTKQSNFSAAAQLYETMLSTIPGTDMHLFDLAALYLYGNNLDAALTTYDRIEDRFGLSQEIVFSKQRIYLKQNKLDSAISEIQEMITLFPDEPAYVFNLSELYISNNRGTEATPYLKAFIREHPEDARARLLLAEVYKQQGQLNQAVEELSIAFLNPELDLTPKLNVLVEYMKQLPDPVVEENSIKLAQSILTAHPYDANAQAVNGDLYLNLANQQKSENYKLKALGYYQKALEYDNSNFNIWQNVLQIEAELSQIDSLQKHSDQAIELFPNQPSLYYYNGFAHLTNDNHEEAVEILEHGRRIARSDPHMQLVFYSLLGDTYHELEEYTLSEEAYEAVLEVDPDNSHVLNNYSYFLALRKAHLDKAKRMSTKLIKNNPNNPTFLDTHAWVLYTMGDYKEAKKFLELALEGDASGTIIEHYGDVLFKLGEIENAVTQWNRAKGMDDTSDLIDKKIADRQLYE